MRAGQTLLLIKISRPDRAPSPSPLPPRCLGKQGVKILLHRRNKKTRSLLTREHLAASNNHTKTVREVCEDTFVTGQILNGQSLRPRLTPEVNDIFLDKVSTLIFNVNRKVQSYVV